MDALLMYYTGPDMLFKQTKTKFMQAKTPDDIRHILALMIENKWMFPFKYFYNMHIGWALPTTQVCEQVVGLWRKYPSARIVDMGAGSGLFCMMFHDAGIPINKLLAVDREEPILCWKTTNTYWDITRNDDFEVPIEDIFFMAWGGGFGKLDERLDSYIKRGGWCVVILGETVDGCTFPSDYLKNNDDWDATLIHVDGLASAYAEHLSINIRRQQVYIFLFCVAL